MSDIFGDMESLMRSPDCQVCDDTGVIETGNNDLPCYCSLGAIALFNEAGVEGVITGEESRRHFQNSSPEPIQTIQAWDLPGRQIGQ